MAEGKMIGRLERIAVPGVRWRPVAAAALLLASALSLGACSKCDVPNFWPHTAPDPPQSCHDGPDVQ